MTTRQETCEERIAEHRESRLEAFRLLTEGKNSEGEESEEAIYEYPLGVSTYRTWRIDLSTGGPADWLEVQEDEGEAQSIRYHFADWFDHAEEELTGEDFDVAETFARSVTADFYVAS